MKLTNKQCVLTLMALSFGSLPAQAAETGAFKLTEEGTLEIGTDEVAHLSESLKDSDFKLVINSFGTDRSILDVKKLDSEGSLRSPTPIELQRMSKILSNNICC